LPAGKKTPAVRSLSRRIVSDSRGKKGGIPVPYTPYEKSKNFPDSGNLFSITLLSTFFAPFP
jgi:hypothetical protein